jgi:hypothetical protein
MSMKNSSDTIGNQTHELPTFSAVPQPNMPPRAPRLHVKMLTTEKLNMFKSTWFRAQTVTNTIINIRFQLDVGDLLTTLGF